MSKGWTFLTNHARVLGYIATYPKVTEEKIAQATGLSLRGVQKIVYDLLAGGYLLRSKQGRCNSYAIIPDKPLRHILELNRPVGDVLKTIDAFPGVDTDLNSNDTLTEETSAK